MVYFIYAIKIGKLERTIQNDSHRSLFKIDWPQKKNESTHHKSFSLHLL